MFVNSNQILIMARVIIASVTYGKCYLWQMYYGKCIMANVIMAKVFMAKVLWQMKLSLLICIRTNFGNFQEVSKLCFYFLKLHFFYCFGLWRTL